MRRRLALLTAAIVLVPLSAVSAAAPTGGGAGIGDPYYPDYGNGGYDVSHYAIDVSYTPAGDRLTGRTTLTATATKSLRAFNLDLVIPVSGVTVDGVAATFRQGTHELMVRPRRSVRAGSTMSVQVDYAGVPSSISSHGINPWIRTANGVAAIGEPEIAAWWFAANDHPRDKATFDVSVSVPESLEVLSNGQLVGNTVSGDRRVWHWREDQPMAPYLADFVVGQFDITQSMAASGIPLITAVEGTGTASGRRAAADLARTPEVVEFESGLWGPYPFDAMGGVVPNASFGFALENQTRPVYSRGFWDGGRNIYVVVHENAHQWFGDSVSVENWRDIWLNEGFATFTEWLWSERHDDGSAAQLFASTYDRPASSSFWKVKIGDPGKGNEFDGAVYDRGAMTLQALRTRIGEEDFFTLMRTWVETHRFGNASIADFVSLAEQVSGQSLTDFFQTWLYTGSRPAATAANGFPAGFSTKAATAPPSAALIARSRAASQAARR